jgi:hypothetical protein
MSAIFTASDYRTHVASGGKPREWIDVGGERGLSFAAHIAYGGSVRDWLEADLPLPAMSGGAITTATQHPLGPPTVSGGIISVPIYLNQPTRINRFVRDITLERFALPRLFGTPNGTVSGGALIYDVVQANDLYLNRDIGMIPPGAEFPIVTSSEAQPSVAVPEKWGAKTYMLDEARDRNDATRLQNEMRRLANTFVRKANSRAMAIVMASVTANSRAVAGHNWSTATMYGASPTLPGALPGADLAAAQKQADNEQLGVNFNTIIWNPQEATNFRNVYQGQAAQVLSDNGINEAFSTPHIAAGTALLVEQGQLGEYRLEKPQTTETWRQPEFQVNWIQVDARPLILVSNPFAELELTGLAG